MVQIKNINAGLDEEEEKAEGTTEATEENAKKRVAFAYWEVGGKEYRLKLTTEQITRLENKYNVNPMVLISKDDVPPLSVMLTIMQAAMIPWHHGIKYEDVVRLYDRWIDEGGSQQDLYNKIIGRTFAVSGFFAKEQRDAILKEIDES